MINIVGSGAFGTALAISIARKGPVTLWARDPDHAAEMAQSGENARRLPGARLSPAIAITSDITRLPPDAPCLLAVPTQKLRDLLNEHGTHLANQPIVACCKGIERHSGLGPVGLIEALVPHAQAAILTGPSFAADIALGLPTALTLACADGRLGKTLQSRLSTPNLRIYRTTDVTGAELGGALKNVVAIACGAVIGAGLGESARAALMTRGFAEMTRMAGALGATPETLTGLSGFGDLVLTCTSDQSRNYRYGQSLGRTEPFDPAITVEGTATARAVLDKANALGIDMPITHAVVALVAGKLHVDQAMDMLLARPLKEE